MAPPKTDPVERFMSKIERTGYCWEWRGSRLSNGYGAFHLNGQQVSAHRHAYLTMVGPIPDGLSVLHSCDNRGCVNPGHLHVGTQADNMREMAERGRKITQPGSRNARAKLSESDVVSIRDDTRALSAISKDYGVAVSTVSMIRSGKRWPHL